MVLAPVATRYRPKFVQLIKLVQEEMGIGNADVRAPKLRIAGEELEATRALIRRAIATRPKRASTEMQQETR